MDRYEVLDVIGSGGMATVWKALDRELDRIVALKRPHPAPPGSELHARFAREARYAAMVNHPNVVAVYDVGTDELGPFLVMEYVDAPSLAETKPDAGDVAGVAADIAAGLSALHAGGIAHGDVKPGNILLAPTGAKLTDFGIARATDPDTTLTGPGQAIGTPAYAAPEVVAANDRSPAADVYSLGVVMTELLTGEPPRSGRTQTMPTDPNWAAVLGPALSARPSDRPTAQEIAASLAVLAGSPAPSAGDSAVTTPMPVAVAPGPLPAPSTQRVALGAFFVGLVIVAGLVVIATRDANDDASAADSVPASSGAEGGADTSQPTEDTEPAPAPTTSPTTTSTSSSTTTTSTTTSTTSTTTSTTEPPPTTTVPTLDDARDRFVALVDRLPRSDVKKQESDAMVDGVDDAIRDAERDDPDDATDELDDVEARIERHVSSSGRRDDLLDALDEIRELLGL